MAAARSGECVASSTQPARGVFLAWLVPLADSTLLLRPVAGLLVAHREAEVSKSGFYPLEIFFTADLAVRLCKNL